MLAALLISLTLNAMGVALVAVLVRRSAWLSQQAFDRGRSVGVADGLLEATQALLKPMGAAGVPMPGVPVWRREGR